MTRAQTLRSSWPDIAVEDGVAPLAYARHSAGHDVVKMLP
jgi:hypothetical protein